MLCEEQCVFHLLASCVAMMLPIMLVLRSLTITERCDHVRATEATCLHFGRGNSIAIQGQIRLF